MKITDLIDEKKKPKNDEPKLSFFDNAFERDPIDEITLPELVKMIQGGTWKKKVETLREALESHGRKKYDEAKRELPAVMLSGWTKTRRSDASQEEREIHHSGFLQGDFDGKDHPHLSVDEIMDLVEADPHVQAAFVSPSGEGVKAVIRIPAEVETHKRAFESASEHFESLGLKLDASTKDPGRLCFVSHDPDAWIRREANAFKPKRKIDSTSNGFEPLDTTADDIREMLSFIPPRPEYDEWLRIASAVWSVMPEIPGSDLLREWSPEEKEGEYTRKYQKRLKEVRIGTLAWYAQANGFDAAEAARRKRWAGRIRFADSKVTPRLEVEPDHADGEERVSDIEGPEESDNPQFVEWCLKNEQRGDAELWQSIVTNSRVYDHFAKCWRSWHGSIWVRDDMEAVKLEFADTLAGAYRDLIAEYTKQIAKQPSEDPKNDPRRHLRTMANDRVKNLNRKRWLADAMSFAQSMPKLAVRASDFDRNPHLLALENGVLDFHACEFREAHPSDMVTHRAGVKFDPNADCPKFREFMNRMLVDPEVVSFVMRSVAYSMTGLVDADVLFFLYGKGANGKSTFMMVFKLLLGDLMTTIDVETLLARRADANIDYKKSTLEGRRAVMTDEIPENRKLGESMVKALIGGDEIVARRPYERPYTFDPTHKLWMVGNHKPVIEGTDTGIWRRICLIPWTQTIPTKERRPRAEVIADFRQELPGILNWVLAGWQELREMGGLNPPAAVIEATEDYRTEQDQLGAFLAERTSSAAATAAVHATDLLSAYLAWCEDNGERPLYKSTRALMPRMRERGFQTHTDRTNKVCVDGLIILSFVEEDEDEGEDDQLF